MARRKIGNSHTTICVSWEDKELFRKFASFVKKTRTGNLYESDAVLFSKMLNHFKENNTIGEISNTTYPSKV
jgi:hypothetical protein|tara:strand:- start:297 stop:512 length:216 start_codon:yes stop_codon:yes gene_type:complete